MSKAERKPAADLVEPVKGDLLAHLHRKHDAIEAVGCGAIAHLVQDVVVEVGISEVHRHVEVLEPADEGEREGREGAGESEEHHLADPGALSGRLEALQGRVVGLRT